MTARSYPPVVSLQGLCSGGIFCTCSFPLSFKIKAQVDQVSDPNTIRAIGQSVGVAEQSFEDEPSLVELKGLVNTRLNVIETNIEAQIARSQREQSQRLIKSSARTLYSGLIISFSFLFIWAKLGRFFRNFNY